jgi:hypothetical protein
MPHLRAKWKISDNDGTNLMPFINFLVGLRLEIKSAAPRYFVCGTFPIKEAYSRTL